jgi:hypothetical protein
MSATGSGNSKKQAKHAAARAMLDLLDDCEGRNEARKEGQTSQNVSLTTKMSSPTDEPAITTSVTKNDILKPAVSTGDQVRLLKMKELLYLANVRELFKPK